MAQFVLLNARAFLGQYDLTGDMNAVAIQASRDMADNTTFSNGGTRSRLPGLKSVAATVEGMFNAVAAGDASDDAFWNEWNLSDVPFIAMPASGNPNQVGYAFRAHEAAYSPGGAVGDMLKYSASLEAGETGPGLIRGVVPDVLTAVASGNTAAYELGAVAANQKLYAVLSVPAFTGTTPTLVVRAQSDDDAGFASPTDRAVFTQMVAPGWLWMEVAGPITDTWWRINYTLGGVTPVATFATFLGIL